jgi:hypothetical protein
VCVLFCLAPCQSAGGKTQANDRQTRWAEKHAHVSAYLRCWRRVAQSKRPLRQAVDLHDMLRYSLAFEVRLTALPGWPSARLRLRMQRFAAPQAVHEAWKRRQLNIFGEVNNASISILAHCHHVQDERACHRANARASRQRRVA